MSLNFTAADRVGGIGGKPRHLVARVAGQFKKFSKIPNQSGLLDT